jgi:glutathione synthase
MSKPRYLIAADPVARIQPVYDTSIRMAAELIARDIEVDYLDLTRTNVNLPHAQYLAELPVQRIFSSDPARTPCLELGSPCLADVSEYAVILQRKDPPVDDMYRAYATHFAQAPAHILQINNPAEAMAHSEHELPMRYPEFSIPTLRCETFVDFVRAVRAQSGEAVAKPENQCSGFGIAFFKNDAHEAELKKQWDEWGPAIVQPYLDEITRSGDLRILVINKKILGSVLRVPRAGSRLANLHQGATGRAFTPTPRQLEAVRVVSEDLTPRGLYLLGLDFIGDQLSEVNITSPSALQQINEVTGLRTQGPLIDAIEELRLAQRR